MKQHVLSRLDYYSGYKCALPTPRFPVETPVSFMFLSYKVYTKLRFWMLGNYNFVQLTVRVMPYQRYATSQLYPWCMLYMYILGELIISAHELGVRLAWAWYMAFLIIQQLLLWVTLNLFNLVRRTFIQIFVNIVLQVAHPPGYPVFTLLAKFIMTVLPYGSPAWKVNLLNSFFASFTGFFLQLTVLK